MWRQRKSKQSAQKWNLQKSVEFLQEPNGNWAKLEKFERILPVVAQAQENPKVGAPNTILIKAHRFRRLSYQSCRHNPEVLAIQETRE